jgi:alkylation response protein AidB-like acyl-CoA dehydrogenase
MANTALNKSTAKGGSFLLESPAPQDVFTPADLSDDQKLIGQTTEEFVLKEVLPVVKDLEAKKPGLMVGLLKKAGELGLMGPGIAEEYGGAGLDDIAVTVLTEKVSVDASFGITQSCHAGLGTVPIVDFGSEDQKRKYLPKLASGEYIGAFALSEPQSGSDARNTLTRAELNKEGTHYTLNGQKMWITNGGFADLFIVFAAVDGDKLTAFIVEREFPGCKPGAEEHKLGLHGSSTTPLFFENCPVPKENVLHEIGRGHVVAFNTLNMGRFRIGVKCVGEAKHVLMSASKYSKERKAFGKPIGEFGLIKEKLAEMAIRIFAAESIIYRTAGYINEAMRAGEDSGKKAQSAAQVLAEYAVECSIAKVHGAEMLDFVVDEAVQIFGGYGFHEDYPVCRAYRDARVNRIFEGTDEINRTVMILTLLKRATGGHLPIIPAAKEPADETQANPSKEGTPAGVLAEEWGVVAHAKKIFRQALGGAVRRFREKLDDEQELIGALANIVMEIYAMESGLLRAQKAAARKGEGATAVMIDAARVFIADAVGRVDHEARRAIAAVHEGDMLMTQLAMLKRLGEGPAVDTIALRRRIAAAVQSQDRYPFDGR